MKKGQNFKVNKSMKIGVLMGGDSSEREISLLTGEQIYNALLEAGYFALPLDIHRDTLRLIKESEIDIAFIALHGRGGEDGAIQGYLELLGIPYTGSGILASALSLAKVQTKRILLYHQIPTPKFQVLYKNRLTKPDIENEVLSDMEVRSTTGNIGIDLPLVVKPNREGSTIGVSIVRSKDELPPAIEKAFTYDEVILVEEYIAGREASVGILNEKPLPPIEIVPASGFYDYQAKYFRDDTEYIIPARFDQSTISKLQELALKTHFAIGCLGISRVDFRIDEAGNPWVLEINSIPGMTSHSLVPKSAAFIGISFPQLVQEILKSAEVKRKI